jgi:hypothetical protein
MHVFRCTLLLRAMAAGAAAAGVLTMAVVTGPAVSARTAAPGVGKATAHGAAGPVSDCLILSSPTCYTPRQFRTAYGIQPLINRGITGRGETCSTSEIRLQGLTWLVTRRAGTR